MSWGRSAGRLGKAAGAAWGVAVVGVLVGGGGWFALKLQESGYAPGKSAGGGVTLPPAATSPAPANGSDVDASIAATLAPLRAGPLSGQVPTFEVGDLPVAAPPTAIQRPFKPALLPQTTGRAQPDARALVPAPVVVPPGDPLANPN